MCFNLLVLLLDKSGFEKRSYLQRKVITIRSNSCKYLYLCPHNNVQNTESRGIQVKSNVGLFFINKIYHYKIILVCLNTLVYILQPTCDIWKLLFVIKDLY